MRSVAYCIANHIGNRYSMRPSVLWNIQARAWGRSSEGELPCILHKTRGFLLYVFYITTTLYLPCNNKNINRKELYDFYYTAITLWQRDINVFYITTTPYLPCNNKNINRKELYDFYYTAITLTTGYKYRLLLMREGCISCTARAYDVITDL